MVADDGLAAEDRGIGVDHDLILDRRVSLGVADDLAGLIPREAQRAERDTLVELDPVPDPRRLADDDARPMVDEEPAADRCPGVDIDPGLPLGVFRHHPRDQRHAQAVQLVGHPIDGDRGHAGVAEDDLDQALGGGVAVVRGLDVLGEDVP